ncbi:N,N-dimethylformamidase beta subunit family domain-containing protein [Hymenobacter sp. BT730]|uniref:DUF4082 domain-containing protein n=1 Tax=Hymenobacter sp. BT730 TaxID=3063332 RepID=UPI0026E035B6|nr:N,N-dimethylformamidase beta subunit family domain-containing protein [Hymenobacter sp. BT730]
METSVTTTTCCRHFQAFRFSVFIRCFTCIARLLSIKSAFQTNYPIPLKTLLIGIFCLSITTSWAQTSNAIVTENAKAGTPASQWQINGAGDLSIQGFTTDISYNKGDVARFKIKTNASNYTINVYRLGYYNGNGARLQGSAAVSASLPQAQPNCVTDPTTGLLDCGNWSESASWQIPTDAVSGVYIAKLTRADNGGASHIVFIVRDDAGTSDLLFQTSDATWQAYNIYGDNNNGKSLYTAVSGSKASKVSYNRPFVTRNGGGGGGASEDWLFNAEYPMIRWLEANGYDVSYSTDVDTDRRGNLLTRHKVFMSVGHDEYWSATARANVTAARNAGKHLAFFSGNEIYWKTRWEASNGQTHRTLVCYKEGNSGENTCGGKCDPTQEWTGLWRDGCDFTSTGGACRPENELSGQISWTEASGPIKVPASYKNLRFWRNTSVATLGTGATATFTDGTIGYEWDPEQEEFRSSYPAGRILLSQTDLGGKTHHISLYKHSSGALVFGAGTVQWSWGLDSNHDRGSAAASQDMRQATVNLFADMGVQPGALQAGLVATTASSDAQAPTVAITAPTQGASLPAGQAVAVSGTASDANVVAGVEVSTDGGATWRLATGTTSWTYSWTPAAQGQATIQSRAFDDSGNMSAPVAVNVTIGQGGTQVCPCTVFQPTAVPTGTLQNDNNQAIQVGMKFRASTSGYITGVRFYKQSGNTGTHIGQLYSNTGTLLAQSTFTNETASGWQEIGFANPVAVTANTTYIISYHSAAGYYSANDFGFTSAIVNEPLRGLANNDDGKNGVYAYSPTPAFPTNNFESSNYYVDVVFNTTVGPDTNPPTVVSTSPANNAAGVLVSANINVTFDEALAPATVSGSTIQLLQGSTPVAASVTYDASSRTATLNPTSDLSYSTSYTLAVKGGTTDPRIKDLANNALAANYSASFTTQGVPPPPPPPLPSPNDGPGGPILVISSSSNAFSRFPVEILRAEGFNEFAAKDISEVRSNTALLNSYDVIVLGNIPLQAADVTLLTNWVTAGGTLIAFRPDAQLASLLGLTPAGGTLSDKYLLVNTASGPGVGIVNETIQFHGAADLYTVQTGTISLATLYSAASSATSNPAVTQRLVGTNGGKAIAFTYDLARSVVYTRQGNPAFAGQKRDGQSGPIRSDDLFFPDWVDLNKVSIPQADEQQRLLANIMVLGSKKPLPRFWYLPKGLKAAVIMTGDDHGSGGTKPRFDSYLQKSASNTAQAVADWTAVRGTSYIYPNTPISNAEAAAYEAQGFELSLHLNTDCATWTPTTLLGMFNTQLGNLAANFPGLTPPSTNRTHCISWSDWASEAKIQAQKGIRLDANYYYWPGAWIQNRPGMFTGSGMPMRFADLDGTLIDCYQATTQLTDESNITVSTHINTLLDNALGAKGYYGVFTANMHTDFLTESVQGSDAIIASAQQRNVPVISAKQMLTWLDGRNSSAFGNMTWNGNQLSFSVSVYNSVANLQGMLPLAGATGRLISLNVNGSPVNYRTEKIKGIDYAFFPATPGSYVASYDGTACVTPTGTLAAAPVQEGQNVNLTYTSTAGTGPFTLVINGKDYPGVVSGTAFDTGVKATSSTSSSLWNNTATPATASVNDAAAVELGVKFQANVAGQITGIRFYKGSGNSGTHTGSLWSSTGTLLATATFTNETATGWQEVQFATPVSIQANTTYVASYFAPQGSYAHSGSFFTSAFTNGPLTALQSGTDGPNGVYKYGSSSSFPTETFSAGNYWVDVLFTAPNSGDGSITFSLTSITDSKGCVQQGDLQVLTVQPTATPNQAPVLAPIGPKSVAASSLLTFTASATDKEGSVLTYSLSGTVPAGALISSAGVFTWTPTPEQVGSHKFKVVVSDGVASAEEEITVTVTGGTPTATACFQDQNASDFSNGTAGTGTYRPASGGVILKPQVAHDFAAAPPTTEWQSFPWAPGGGTTTFSGTQAVVDGARFNTEPLTSTSSPGTSLEFVATFGAVGFQHIGFGAGNDVDMYNNTPTWAMFSTGTNDNFSTGLKARVNNNGTPTDVVLPGNLYGTAHRYRIDWKASSIEFYIDGALVQTTNVAISTPMRVGASDLTAGGLTLFLDWVRVTPFAQSGSFTSRIYDGSTAKTWSQATWDADTPNGTSVKLFQRQGNTPTPDANWTAFTDIANSGANVGGTSRYIQYRADLATSNTGQTPTLRSVGINCATPSCVIAFTPATGSALPAATVGAAYNQTISTDPTGYSLVATGLPAGLSLDATTGVISGMPTQAVASASVTVTASKDGCSVDAAYTLVVNAVSSPTAQTISFTQALPDVKTSAGPITLSATASSGLAVSYSVTGPATINGNVLTLTGATGQVKITASQAGNATYAAAQSVERFFNVTSDAVACFQDQSVADFNAGTAGATASVSQSANGGVTLMAKAANDFAVAPTAAEWQSFPWNSGGATNFSGGQAVVDGARFNTMAASAVVGPGASLEFDATFGAAGFQHIGFGAGNDVDMYNNTPIWAMFSTGNGTTSLQARVNNNGTATDVVLTGTELIGKAHHFRIDWKAASIDFYVDGALVQTANVTLSTPMRAGASDFNVGGPVLSLDQVLLTPYASSGSFTSRVYDGGSTKAWQEATWTADVPTGTSVQLLQRQGNTATPDGSWTSFNPIAGSGTKVGGTSRYIQYRADLATSNTGLTPTLQSMGINCAAPAECPTVAFTPVASSALPDASVGEAYSQTISTDLPGYSVSATGLPAGLTINAASGVISGTPTAAVASASVTITATKESCSANAAYTLKVKAASVAQAQTISFTQALPNVTTSAAPITLTATASSGLSVSYSATGPATVEGNVLTLTKAAGVVVITASQAGNATYAAAQNVERTFTVTAESTATACFQDQSVSDYNAGTAGTGISVAQTANGGLTLKAQVSQDFTTTPSSSEWLSFPWGTGGGTTFSAGQAVVNGARYNTEPVTAAAGPGASLEFEATFGGANFQHIGFGAGDDAAMYNTVSTWAMFSTGTNAATGLKARVSNNGTQQPDVILPGSLYGTAHRYRIDWKAASIEFYVDGALVHTASVALSAPMRVGVSDFTVGGPAVSLDRVLLTPYASSGNFTSRVYDGGSAKTWQEATWTADTPNGTSVQLFQRQGNTATPDANWTSFNPIGGSGTKVGGTSRYIQYRADLATSDTKLTPTLYTVGINCGTPTCPAVVFTPADGSVLPTASVGAVYSQTISTDVSGYSFSATGLPAGLTINAASGVISGTPTGTVADAAIIVTATKESCTVSAAYTLSIISTNQPPVLQSIGSKSVPALSTLTFTAAATDADTDESLLRFSLAGTVPEGAVIEPVTGAFSWTPTEAQIGEHNFKVMVSDGQATGQEQITVTVSTPAPTDISLSKQSVEENKPIGTVVGTLSTTSASAAQNYSYALIEGEGGTDNASFQVVGSDLQTGAAFNFEGKLSYSVRVRATSNAASGATFEKAFVITVTDVNEAPVLAAQTFSVGEGSATSSAVGTVVASDPDANQTLTYSITAGNTNDAFKMVGNQLQVNNGSALNYATTPSFSLTVKAQDSANPSLSTSATITVNVTDVNGAPVIAAQSFSLDENKPNESTVGTVAASDSDDGQTLTFSITAGNDAGAFKLEGNVLKVANAAALDFEQTAEFSLTVAVTDNGDPVLSSSATITITLNPVNEAPVLANVPASAVTIPELAAYTFTATGSDPENDNLSFSLVNAPAGAGIGESSGIFSWTPTEAQGPGTYDFSVRVSDGKLTSELALRLIVSEVSSAPVLAGVPESATIPELAAYSFQATGTDGDGNELTYSLVNAPVGAGINSSGLFTWTPSEAQGPGEYDITVRVSDGSSNDEALVHLTVEEVNAAPVLSSIADASIPELAEYTFKAAASDAENSTLLYSLLNAPEGALIDGATGDFKWTPTEAQGPNKYTFSVRVSDGSLTDEQEFSLTVTEVGSAPVLSAVPASATIPELSEYTFTASATDVDSENLTFSLVNAPQNASINETTGVFSWIPSEEQGPNEYTFTVRVSDGSLEDDQAITLTVTEVSVAPELTGVPTEETIPELTTYSFTASVSNVDGSAGASPTVAPVYSLKDAPVGASINPSTGVFSWMPTEAQGPGDYTFTVNVAVGSMQNEQQVILHVEEVVLVPTIASFSPTAGPEGTVVTISGTNLGQTESVRFNGLSAQFSIRSDAQLVATVPAEATTGLISLTTPEGKATSQAAFTVTPVILSFTPTTGPVGTEVLITGTSLLGATSVQFFNGVEAGRFEVRNSTTIMAVVPVGARTGKLTVITPNGQAKSTQTFTVTKPSTPVLVPAISLFTPVSGPVGTTVTILGSNLEGATEVTFNGTPCLEILSKSATEVVVQVPSGAQSGTISVKTPLGVATSKDRFKVTTGTPSEAPVITSFTPDSGPIGTLVTIYGSNLGSSVADISQVTFNGTPCDRLKLQWISASQIKAVVPAGAKSGQIMVTTGKGSATSKDRFRVTKGIATVSLSSGLITEPAGALPTALQALQAYPNPIQGKSQLSFSLAKDESFMLDVYDMRGSKVRSLGKGTAQAGHLNTFDIDARLLEEGIYIVRLVTGSEVQTTRITVRK